MVYFLEKVFEAVGNEELAIEERKFLLMAYKNLIAESRGWIQYVKEKNLKAGDIITFQKSTGPDKQFYIERRPANRTGNVTEPFHPGVVVIRLFGVDIRRTPIDSVNVEEGCNGKKAREMEFLSMESRRDTDRECALCLSPTKCSVKQKVSRQQDAQMLTDDPLFVLLVKPCYWAVLGFLLGANGHLVFYIAIHLLTLYHDVNRRDHLPMMEMDFCCCEILKASRRLFPVGVPIF
ncbi:hypothetical protein Nepgr_002002 [Nepenthes gracilis]|uniref:Uncharacterized protein n=1 Tax=Nepenthes gracilis TaxID=150966 RepID=A0AAD3P659_NEPGR|nr:hypothetical protein Nepgr_002002 [Nepenthes gracilis]